MKLPVLAADLIALLDEQFPDRCPKPTESDREIWINVGRRDVVAFLLARQLEQQEAAEDGKDKIQINRP